MKDDPRVAGAQAEVTRKKRSEHSAADEKRIDKLQSLATELVGRGAAVGLRRELTGRHRAVVFDARGEEVLSATGETKAGALESAAVFLRIPRKKVYP